jgi:hypothetical protein
MCNNTTGAKMSYQNEPQTKEATLVEGYGGYKDSLDAEFLITDLAAQLIKAKALGYDKVTLHTRTDYDNEVVFELIATRLETPQEIAARLVYKEQALKNRAVYALQNEAAVLTREEVLAAWEAGQRKKE